MDFIGNFLFFPVVKEFKNFENRLRFDEVTAMVPFYVDTVYSECD